MMIEARASGLPLVTSRSTQDLPPALTDTLLDGHAGTGWTRGRI